jgi:hypothetical protein
MLYGYAARAQTVCQAGWFSPELILQANRCSGDHAYTQSLEDGLRVFNGDIQSIGHQSACARALDRLSNWLHR